MEAYAKYGKAANEYIPSADVEFRSMKAWPRDLGDQVNVRYVLDVFNKPKEGVDERVNVCLKQYSRETAILDGCKSNATVDQNIDVNRGIILGPIISIPVKDNPSGSSSVIMKNPKDGLQEGYPYQTSDIECPLLDKQLDVKHKYECVAKAEYSTEGYEGAEYRPNEYWYPKMYIVYGIFEDTDKDYQEYSYPGCAKRLF